MCAECLNKVAPRSDTEDRVRLLVELWTLDNTVTITLMPRFDNLTDDERKKLFRTLEDRYFLIFIRKNTWWYFLGGMAAFVAATFAVSWAGTRAGFYSNRAEAAEHEARTANEEIQKILAALKTNNLVLVNDRVTFPDGRTFCVKSPNDKGRFQFDIDGKITWYTNLVGGNNFWIIHQFPTNVIKEFHQ
jgi:hypothetical protein